MTSKVRLLAVAHDDEPTFAAATAAGKVLLTGTFPGQAPPSDIVVVSDYSLLVSRDLAGFALTQQIGLLPPQPSLSAPQIVKFWSRERPGGRARIAAADLTDLAPVLQERRELATQRRRAALRVAEHLRALAPEYLRVLCGPADTLPDELIPFVAEFPSPRALVATPTAAVASLLRSLVPDGRRDSTERILQLATQPAPAAADRSTWNADAVLPAAARIHAVLHEQIAAIDAKIFRFAHAPWQPEGPDTLESFPIPLTDTGRLVHETASAAPPCPTRASDIASRMEQLLRRRCVEDREPARDAAEFGRLTHAWKSTEASPDPARRLRHATIGQLLALSAGDVAGAREHFEVCRALLEGPPDTADPDVLGDAALACAITQASSINLVEGLSSLQQALQSGPASAELLSEAAGLLELILVVIGAHKSHTEVIAHLHPLMSARKSGPARAPHDISTLFLIAGDIRTPRDRVLALLEIADRHSAGTPYRAFFDFTRILVAMKLNDPDMGIRSHDEIMRQGHLPTQSRPLFFVVRAFYAVHLAAAGDFARARRELQAPSVPHEQLRDDSALVIGQTLLLRLAIAVGDYPAVLAATSPTGRVSPEVVAPVQQGRYLCLVYLARGSALWHGGQRDRAAKAFLRAITNADDFGQWYGFVCAMTDEFLAWLGSLDPASLPDPLTVDLRTALLNTPQYISLSYPSLTPQQTRILRLLAQGRSMASIAAELHVTTNTMKSHCQRLYARLGVNSRAQAVELAGAYGLA